MNRWEKYVEKAAEALDPDVYDEADPHYASQTYQFRREIACKRVGRVLAAVGPLIQEDARERIVAAAGKALEREGGVEWKATLVPRSSCKAAAAASGAQLIEVRDEVDRKYAFNGDEADEVWMDKP